MHVISPFKAPSRPQLGMGSQDDRCQPQLQSRDTNESNDQLRWAWPRLADQQGADQVGHRHRLRPRGKTPWRCASGQTGKVDLVVVWEASPQKVPSASN